MACQWDFQANPQRCAGKYCNKGFATFFGFEIHACKFDFTQNLMNLHDHVETALRWICGGFLPNFRNYSEIHASRKVSFGRGDYHAFYSLICDTTIDYGV